MTPDDLASRLMHTRVPCVPTQTFSPTHVNTYTHIHKEGMLWIINFPYLRQLFIALFLLIIIIHSQY